MPESVRKNFPFAAIFSTSSIAARRLTRVWGAMRLKMVPEAGIEPARLAAGDFEETGTATSY